MREKIRFLAGVSLGMFAFCSSAHAQEVTSGERGRVNAEDNESTSPKSSGGLSEIVVTAQRRDQRLQEVGVSVTALESDDLKKLGIVSSSDISKAVAGVLMDSSTGGGLNANLTVRGISQSDFSSVQESPNSTYIDDIYLSSANMAAFTLYDLERIEVLRGPQGTLFGRASSGGLANFVVAKPTRYLTGYIQAGYGSFNNSHVEGALSGPITDNLRFRMSGRRETADGWFENGLPDGNSAFARDFYGLRLQLEADVTASLTARLSVSYDKNPKHFESTYRASSAYIVNGLPQLLPEDVDAYGTGPGNDLTGYRNPYQKFNKSDFNSEVSFLQNERFSPSLYLTINLGSNITLTSISNYTDFSYSASEDTDAGPLNYLAPTASQDLSQWSQELRLNGTQGNLTYTAGFFYLKTKQSTPGNFYFPILSGSDFAFDATNEVHQDMKSWALYGQIEYQFTPKLSAILGIRYTKEVKNFSSQSYLNELGAFYGGSGVYDPPILIYDFSKDTVGSLATKNEGLWSGKLGLNYQPNKNTLFYVSASRGVKAAGFNPNFGTTTSIEKTPFKSEYVYAYEGGSKLEILDRRVRVNSSVFHYDYHRFQGYAFVGIQGIVDNYDGKFTGGELEIAAAPTMNLDMSLSAAYLDSKLYNVPTVYNGVRDQRSIMAPRWMINGNITKRFDLSFGTLSLNWNGNFIDDRYASIDNNNATFVPSSFVHNARVSLNIEDKDLELAFFVNNISNAARQQFRFDLTATSGNWINTFAPPRWIGASIRKSF